MMKNPPTWVGVLSMRWHISALLVLLVILLIGGAL